VAFYLHQFCVGKNEPRDFPMRWHFVNNVTPTDPEHKYWYWIHITTDNREVRSKPFESLHECIWDARKNGLTPAVEGRWQHDGEGEK
jgi:hypothetical protein